MASEDLKSLALNPGKQDFYSLLDVEPTANDSEIRRAYRKTALKYHPDKVGASDAAALDKFHLLQIAYDILSDNTLRELYDNARRAREEKKLREAAYDDRRRQLKEDLERREREGLKRKREPGETVQDEDDFERELRRIAEDGKRRRKEMEERLRKEAAELEEEERKAREGGVQATTAPATPLTNVVSHLDRSVAFRYLTTPGVDRDKLLNLWQRFGKIEECVLRDKKVKVEGEKHRKGYTTVMLVYESITGAHAAVTDFEKMKSADPGVWSMFENVDWASGKEPECIPKQHQPMSPAQPASNLTQEDMENSKEPGGQAGLKSAAGKKTPTFASFKSTSAATGASLDEITLIRLKNAQRRREAQRQNVVQGAG